MDENKEQLKNRIGDKAFDVTQNSGTEAPFSGEYVDLDKTGTYHCKVCGAELFSSDVKSDSRSGPAGLKGWPHFRGSLPDSVATKADDSLGMQRTEVLCKKCGAHLGHVFEEGSEDGKHYCVNSCSLDFKEK